MSILRQPVSKEKAILARELRRSMTVAERILWERLRSNRLEKLHFRRQQVIRGFIVDFYCHAIKLVIEIDGPVHNSQVYQDRERDQILEQYGFNTIRFTNHEVETDLDNVLAKILNHAKNSRNANPR